MLTAKSSRGVKVQATPRRARSKAAGKGRQSNYRKNMAQDRPSPSVQKETANRRESTESTKEDQPSTSTGTETVNRSEQVQDTEEPQSSQQDQPSTSTGTETVNRSEQVQDTEEPQSSQQQLEAESESCRELSHVVKDVTVTYKWKDNEQKVTANPTERIIDIMETYDVINKDEEKYLIVSVSDTNAVINPWVPCGALHSEKILKMTVKNINSPEPSVYPTFSDLKCFTVKRTSKTIRKVLRDLQYSDNKPLVVYGYKDQSIRQALERDTRFDVTSEVLFRKGKYPPYLSIYSKNLRAELNSSVPCGALEEGEELTVSIRKGKSPELYEYPLYNNGKFFRLDKSSNLKSKLHEKHYYNEKPLAVYGAEDQSIEEALANDKRFHITEEFVLRHSGEPECSSDVPLSDLKQENFYSISEVKGKKFGKRKHTEMQDTQTTDGTRLNVPRDSPALPKKTSKHYKEKHNKECASFRSAASSKFSNAYNNLPPAVKTEILQKSRIDYMRNLLYKIPVTAKFHDTLNTRKSNVAAIGHRALNKVMGTLFLLNPTLALTCHHVIKDLQKYCTNGVFDICFNYDEDPYNDNDGRYFAKATTLFPSEDRDFAFLRIDYRDSPPENHPLGLLQYVALPPAQGTVSIIGHPGGACKRVDAMCSVIEYGDRAAAIASAILSNNAFLHLFTKYSYVEMMKRKNVTYDSCMYHGSSGAPVFNDRGMLVAMHTGGYDVETDQKKKSVIEYGRSICDIIKRGIQNNQTIREELKDFDDIIRRNSPTPEDCEMTPV